MKIAVGLSGGIDSAVASRLLLDQGHEVCGVTLRLLGENENSTGAAVEADRTVAEAAAVAASLGIPHVVYDFRKAFKEEVIGYFIESYRAGETPNPCYICNKRVKFGLFLERALQDGFDAIATGHYAKIFMDKTGRYGLAQGADRQKDQSYFLALLDQHQLSRSIFPLADYTKPEIRRIAEKAGMVNAHKADSQDICFVPNGDYTAVIESRTPQTFPSGDFIDISGKKVGTHRGLHRYTIGQRRGLALPFGYPIYVVEKSAAYNTITVGTAQDLNVSSCMIRNVNWIAAQPNEPFHAAVKTRYRQQFKSAIVEPVGDTDARIVFIEPERAVARGQAAVFYRDECVVGGGIISEVSRISADSAD